MIPMTSARLLADIREAIRGITPTIQTGGNTQWRVFERALTPGSATRSAYVQIESSTPLDGGLWGIGAYEVSADVIVMATYAIAQHLATPMLETDGLQLYDAMMGLRAANSGVVHVVSNGNTVSEINADTLLVTHRYEVRYLRSSEV